MECLGFIVWGFRKFGGAEALRITVGVEGLRFRALGSWVQGRLCASDFVFFCCGVGNPKAQMALQPYIIWSLSPKALKYESLEP